MAYFNKSLIGFLIIGSALLAACKSSDATPTYMLGMSQSARLSSDVIIRVDSIRDGRCPLDLVCITAGTASAQLTISKDFHSYQRQLYVGSTKNRYGYRSDSTVVSFGNLVYSIVLQDITPHRVLNTQSKDQQAFLLIYRL